jgi:hypothetical protein
VTLSTTNAVPNPGSDEAIMRGCTCPVIDNGHGKGYMGGAKDAHGSTLFVYTCGCPVHAPALSAQERDDGR